MTTPERLDDRRARMALSAVVESGEAELSRLVDDLGASEVWRRARDGTLGAPLAGRAARLDLRAVLADAAQLGMRFVMPGDAEWPAPLEDLRRAEPVQRRGGLPLGLWLRGTARLADSCRRAVAIVGSRAATAYGTAVATELAADLAERQVTVLSGGAYGIDAAAHRGALAAGGRTVAVLAGGADVPYPKGNEALLDRIAADHVIVSELPPGAAPTRMRFLARNRLIAALADGVIVVEAALRSGARNTANWAVGTGRVLMALPGPVHSTLSAGPHLLVREGQATLVTSAADVLELISPVGQQMAPVQRGERRVTDGFDPIRLAVFEAVPARRRRPSGEIALIAGVPLRRALAELTALEGEALVDGSADGWRLAARTGETATPREGVA
ncbi:DNA-processing protein DprA [Microlunatus parietis]|uniref:DNA processing protein n=1 Tax=Microlunatus parietis TaxID=682979 RepID=A0A7Y9LFR5_9ACTN|nr:DNA-processing protein DprA [Microlunatus parietis]NYE75118.1 DNA processing protein [Microlunatus parietis]